MQKRRVLVTGGTKGIGKATSVAFHKDGHRVAAIYDRDDESAHNFAKETGIEVFKFDVADFEQCKNNISKIKESLGGNVEILINNAGIARDGMLHKQSYENWLLVINTDLCSVFNMTRAVIEEMRSQNFGRIINISSVNANGRLGQTNYSAAKAGIEGFTKALALEGGRCNVTCNAIAPGYTDTEMVAKLPQEMLTDLISKVPLGRLGKPEEIASVAFFLAGEGASFVNGAVIPVNGGYRT